MSKLSIVGLIAITLFTACSENGKNTSTTNSETTETTASGKGSAGTPTVGDSIATNASTASYVDLYTGTPIEVERDAASGNYLNRVSHETVQFYVNTSTSDTFDMKGRVVNNALLRADDGKFTVNEAKVKIDSDGDVKIKGRGILKLSMMQVQVT